MSAQMPPVKTRNEYHKALDRINQIIDAPIEPETRPELRGLIEQVKLYENEHFPINLPDVVFAIKFRMEHAGLSKDDLVPCFGSLNKTSNVLAGKREITLSMARSLHHEFGIPVEILLGERGAKFNPNVDIDELKHFPWKEMQNRGWVKSRSGWKDYLEEMWNELARIGQAAPMPSLALLRETGKHRTNANPDTHAVQAWCLRVANRAADKPSAGTYVTGTVTHDFMRNVANLSIYDDGPRRAQKYLADHRINLVIEQHLPRTYLDGAVFRLSNEQPVIGLTLRHDRLDNFWFTLMHELAHINLHLDKGNHELFIDEIDFSTTELDLLEKTTDKYAADALIPPNLWESSMVQFTKHEADVYELAHKANVHTAIIAGRIRYENNEYRKLSQFIGRGKVRNQFERQE